jgi:cathepsin C
LRKYLSEVRNQGGCGSCYIMATVAMLEARVRYLSKMKKNYTISEQHLLNCNYYSQGCMGGFAYELLRYIKAFGAPDSECIDYSAKVH